MKTSLPTLYDVFDDVFNSFGTIAPNSTSIPTDIYRKKDSEGNEIELVLDFAISGLDINNIDMHLDDNILTVEYNKTESEDSSNKIYTQRQISRKSWKTQYRLVGNKLSKEEIVANYENGILSIRIPIIEDNKTIKKIPLLKAESGLKGQLGETKKVAA